MICTVKLFSLNVPACDGSVITADVCRKFLESKQCKEDLENKLSIGSCSHRCRSAENAPASIKTPLLGKTIGKDDLMLIPEEGCGAVTHIIEDLWIEGDWCMGKIRILDENEADELSAKYIKRLKFLIKSGIRVPISSVIIAFWKTEEGTGKDYALEIKRLRGADFTFNESFKGAGIVSAEDDNGEKIFSNTSDSEEVRTFSAPSDIEYPKTSKINGQFGILKVKEYSTTGYITEMSAPEEKTYSVATLKERVRYAKMSPRLRFRRLFLEYKQLVKQMGGAEKIDPETLKTMKSLFLADVNQIFSGLTTNIMEGKQINTLIGASSLGKGVRVAAQKLQLPYRMAFQELQKTGKITPMRFEKIKEAYTEFAHSLVDEVFGNNPIPESLEEDINKEEGQENA